MQDREKLIKYNRAFIKKNKKIPTTTLDFYKFVKVKLFGTNIIVNRKRRIWKSDAGDSQTHWKICGNQSD